MILLLATANAAQLPCRPVVHSTLPGVRIEVPEQACNFTEGQMAGHRFTWTLHVETDVGTVVNTAGSPCDRPDPSGFMPTLSVTGGGLSYRDDDRGDCVEPTLAQRTTRPTVGVTPQTWLWEGHAWGGQSCTNEPYGPAFPPGEYTWSVVLEGTRDGAPWTVKAELPVRIHRAR